MSRSKDAVTSALARLRGAADEAGRGWYPRTWQCHSGSGPVSASMRQVESPLLTGAATFVGLKLVPGEDLVLSTTLDLPATLAGTDVLGEPLMANLASYYPMSMVVDGRQVFEDVLPPVASGPALFELLPGIVAGARPELTVTIHAPHNQVHGEGIVMSFTTPTLWARFLALDIAWAQLLLGFELAVTDEEVNAVDAAASGLSSDLLALDEVQLEAALSGLASALAPVSERIAQRRVHAIGHSHIDLQWQWTWEDSKEVIKRDVRSVLSLMEDFPAMTFTHSQPASYEVLRLEEPELFEKVRDRVAEGRWEPATMQWVESDVNMVSGEAQVRQLLEAAHWTHQHLGVTSSVHLAPDTFGHAGNLPQLTVSAGARVYYHHRGNPGQASGGSMWPAYWWAGDDGTRLLSVSTPVYLGPLTPGRVAQDVLSLTKNGGLSSCLYFYGVGDHGGGPTRRDLETLAVMQEAPCLPSIFCSTLARFADEVTASGAALPEHRGESPTIFEGCYTTHVDAKRLNRVAENELVASETLATLAGQDRTEEFSAAWRTTLFHQFHDILCGSAIKEAYELTATELTGVIERVRQVGDEAVSMLQGGIPAGQIAVTNPLGFDRSDVVVVPELAGDKRMVLDERDRLVPTQSSPDGLRFLARVPAFGTVAYQLSEQAPPSSAIVCQERGARYLTVDTPDLFAMVRRDSGIITTLFDRRSERELVGYNIARAVNCEQVRPDLGLGVLQLLEERPHGMSSWVIDEVFAEHSLISGAELEVVESGPVRMVLETRHSLRASKIRKRVIFYAGLARIDIELEVEWNEQGSPEIGISNLALAFTTRQEKAEAWYETPFAASSRAADGLVVPGLRWADIGGADHGIALLNDGKYGFDALGSRLRAHIIRSAYEPDTVADTGYVDRCAFAVVPHEGTWRSAGIAKLAAEFNVPLIARLKTTGAPPHLPWRPHLLSKGSVMIDALKSSHDGTAVRVIRLHESAGHSARATIAGLGKDAVVHSASVTEKAVKLESVHQGKLELTFRPFEVKTLLVSRPDA
jgi:alpha-mannosidase